MDGLLFGRSLLRREILLQFFGRPSAQGHVREIARRLGRAASAVGRELDRLEGAGILRSATQGRNRTYEVDTDSPNAGEIRTLIQRTIGVEALLQAALRGIRGIDRAWIFGSYASHTDRPDSDLDVLIIGSPGSDRLRRSLARVESRLRRDINLVELTQAEFARLVRRREPFIRDVLRGPIVILKGNDAERSLAQADLHLAEQAPRSNARLRSPGSRPRARR